MIKDSTLPSKGSDWQTGLKRTLKNILFTRNPAY
jgi:hypothetical protein